MSAQTSIITDAGGVGAITAVEDGKLILGTTQDCTPIAERTKEMQRAGMVGSSEMRLAASIPRVIVEKYLNDHNITWLEFGKSPEHKKRLLNDPANSHFRVWAGRV